MRAVCRGGAEHVEDSIGIRAMSSLQPELKQCLDGLGHAKSVCFNPCKAVNSLLITFPESGGMHSLPRPGQPSPALHSFAAFRHRPQSGAAHCAEPKSISRGADGGHPNRNNRFRPDGHAVRQPEDEFAPAFFEGKLRCKNTHSNPQLKGRHARQPNE